MKILDHIVRFIVGALFTFSGFVKLVDPKGTKYKLQEYFSVFSNDIASFFEYLIPASLTLAVIFVVLETLLGIVVLLNYRMKITSWVLLGLILFFTFLTFYSAYFNKVTDCGCFGDFLHLSPWTSFWKDMLLLIMIVYMFMRRHTLQLQGQLNDLKGDGVLAFFFVLIFWFSIHNIRHLPFIDFRPYKVGNDLQQLKDPQCDPGQVKEVYKFVNKASGEVVTVKGGNNTQQYFNDTTTYAYKSYERKKDKACRSKIPDYAIFNESGEQVTEKTFEGNKLIIVIRSVKKADRASFKEVNKLIAQIKDQDIQPMVLTATSQDQFEIFRHKVQLAVPYYTADAVVLKTMIRSSPGLMLLQEGVVKGKWHYNDVPDKATIQALINE